VRSSFDLSLAWKDGLSIHAGTAREHSSKAGSRSPSRLKRSPPALSRATLHADTMVSTAYTLLRMVCDRCARAHSQCAMKGLDSVEREQSAQRPGGSPSSRGESTEVLVRAAQIRMVSDGAPRNTGAGILAAVIIATAVVLQTDRANALYKAGVWFVLLTVGLIRGILMSHRASKESWGTDAILQHGRRLARNSGYCAVIWGSASWLLLPASTPELEVFVLTAIAMVLMGGAGAQAAYRGLVLSSGLLLSLTFAAGLFRFGDENHFFLGIGFLLFTFVTLIFARNQEDALRKQVIFGLERESLRAAAENERARADSASRAKTAFLAAASHDLRQPMHALVQYCEHLRRENRDMRLDETIKRIDWSLNAMQDLLDSILDLSKIMMGGVQPVLTTVRVGSMLERLDAQLRPMATSKGLHFVIGKSEALIRTDDVLLERILRNLTLNAIRYTETGRVLVRCRQRTDSVELQVWDTGIGIPRDELSKIYDPFYQVGNEARDRRKGLGVGLAIVRQLCDILGYDIRVRSVVGKGTVFAVRAPLSTESVSETAANRSEDMNQRDYVRGAFVILIDDDRMSREASEHTLREFGCRVISASSGLDAVAKLQNQEFAPNIIIADYRMEGETGLEAIKMITENLNALFGEQFSIPALVVSGDTSPEELRRVTESGYPMLHKPVAVAAMRYEMNRQLERKAREIEF
jgi:two-component system, sensor histidine kinase